MSRRMALSTSDITTKKRHSVPLHDSAFGSLHRAQIFSKLNLWNANLLVWIHQGEEWKTTINTPLGHFEYLVMPFSLTNAPTVFKSLVNNVQLDILNKFVFIYIDILIFSKTRGGTCSASPQE